KFHVIRPAKRPVVCGRCRKFLHSVPARPIGNHRRAQKKEGGRSPLPIEPLRNRDQASAPVRRRRRAIAPSPSSAAPSRASELGSGTTAKARAGSEKARPKVVSLLPQFAQPTEPNEQALKLLFRRRSAIS